MPHPRTWIAIATLAGALLAHGATPAVAEVKPLYVAPFIGWTFFDNDRLFQTGEPISDDVYFGGRAGARMTDLLGIEIAGGYAGTKDCASCTESWLHFSGNLVLSPAPAHILDPFVSVGAGWSRSKHTVGSDDDAATVEVAVGARMRLNETFGLRLEARNVMARSHDGWSKSHINDVVVGAGLTIGFGGNGDPEVARSEVIYETADPDMDSDGDGVVDRLDRCPNTPPGTKVDRQGCTIVPPVDILERELLDTGRVAISDVNFDYDKSDLRPDAYAAMDSVGKVLTKWPGLRIQIDAYTDSRGTEAYNMELSHRRAESVREYLLRRYPQFDPTQLTARNYGEKDPVVPNTSAANMQLNRRVEFLVLNKEILEQRK